ncbi:bis(5'-nucleosyl)-tetraphosphatase (symmetrical) YqeK [Pseudalkalibacillus salsuginis]|uniref:bis(5'-nucleosyl)-tetraphosphatase (symmetrical) YqeK n=1 Tax=Pseudalkalibacillus salsuginis TaxID=2910972 RepID=UPI001F164E4E|nr:bis(5'-nucleosyl)-tetraphosphatase (symmetrical) YqeK [Pseudalkalibacillus salsuginis]MCF6408560.1 bis(5'-nucleosyl)-tetraphosphatase (symmetrical) YqeK [Pseudalkalibacillus salsuginis]
MTKDEALKIVREQLTEHRYHHTIGVMDTAIRLAERFGENSEKAMMAAIFHDYAKFRPKDEMKSIILEQKLGEDILLYGSELWHAPVGAYLVRTEVGIEDEEILLAIKSHTSGRPGMTLLEKIIFLADYIEPGRRFPGVDDVRSTAEENLDNAIKQSLVNTIIFLMRRNQLVYPETLHTYNDMVHQQGGKNE